VAPANNGSYLQRVPIDIVASQDGSMRAEATGKATATLRYPEDVVVWAGASVEESGARAPVVFVGYGVTAPEFRWDDFKNVDVKGKILLVLVNDPPAPTTEPNLFGGKAMTYYGRWTYKFEEAERRGAAGMLIVHDTERAGYGWPTVVGSWAKEQRMLPRDPKLPEPLGFRGWITEDGHGLAAAQAGLDLARLRRDAESRRFRPVETGITLDIGFTNTVAHLESHNVAGTHRRPRQRGRGGDGDALRALGSPRHRAGGERRFHLQRRARQRLGHREPPRHRAAARAGAAPARSVLVAFVTAEESGLLGSEYLARNPLVPTERLVANLNVDGGNVLGETRDLTVLGDTKSSLGPELAAMIESARHAALTGCIPGARVLLSLGPLLVRQGRRAEREHRRGGRLRGPPAGVGQGCRPATTRQALSSAG
jgi:hypothetical protein